VLIFSDFNIRKTYWSIWLLLSFVLMLLYELYWVRYFRSERELKDFYSSFFGIPVAGATYPVLAFFCLGIYGSNVFLLVAVVVLGIGHIGIHLQHRNSVLEKKKRKLPIKILKWVGRIVCCIIACIFVFVIGARNVNYFKHYQLTVDGVDEETYLTLGGQEQYVLMRGKDVGNPVIVYLHGGPASPDTYYSYGFTDYLVDDYTVICWDQRGSGRTYFHNADVDEENATATFEQAEIDLDELVDYAMERFGKDKVIIMGHSYGTILGSVYAQAHPEKVAAYIGVAQVVSIEEADIYSYQDALQKAIEAGDDTTEIVAAYEKFLSSQSLVDMMALRSLVVSYHPATVADKSTWMALTSPYCGINDIGWLFKQLGDLSEFFALNEQLFDYTMAFDAYDRSLSYEVPVYFISGTCDWVCPVDSVEKYADAITAPDVKVELIEGCGHGVQYAEPEKFANCVLQLLDGID
jgi:pimeloyl-ACP methyl ester carboxylesterase